jgi:hypothetical protein
MIDFLFEFFAVRGYFPKHIIYSGSDDESLSKIAFEFTSSIANSNILFSLFPAYAL